MATHIQASRDRNLTIAFRDEMLKLHDLANADGADFGLRTFGPYAYHFHDGRFHQIKHDGGLVAQWDIKNNRQYGAVRDIQGALKEYRRLHRIEDPDLQEKQHKKFASICTQMETLLKSIREIYPDAGYAIANNQMLLLRDINQAETPENIVDSNAFPFITRSVI